MDWRSKGAVTPIKMQFTCGAGWAFAAVASIGLTKIINSELVTLSEQQVIDCDTHESNKGCSGGSRADAFDYISIYGIPYAKDYSYLGMKKECKKTKTIDPAFILDGYENVRTNDEIALMHAVANQPVSVAIAAMTLEFRPFKGNAIYEGPCSRNLTHAVALVGYGTDEDDGTDYWLIKNSWGTQWGDHGYMRLKRNVHSAQGLCGIAMIALYPIDPRWKRAVLKISGAVLAGTGPQNVDPKVMMLIAREAAMTSRVGVEVAIVVGGRNFFCGDTWVDATGTDRATTYQIRMMASVMNAILLQAYHSRRSALKLMYKRHL